MASPHTITHDHTISVWFYDLSSEYVYVCVCECRRERRVEWEGEGPDRGRATDMCEQKEAHLYTDRHRQGRRGGGGGGLSGRMHANTHKHGSPPSTRRLSMAFLSLPLAVSQIPDDVLTGGLSDWRWGCVMTDQGLYQWPAHCQLAVWRLTGRLKPKPAAVPASLHISFLFFPSSFNPYVAGCRSSPGLM